MGLSGVKSLRHSQILQVLVVSKYQKLMSCSLQPMPPHLKCQLDGQNFSVADIIIHLCRVELAGEEGTWMEPAGVSLLL